MTCAKFVVKTGAQNTFLPLGAGYPSYATGDTEPYSALQPFWLNVTY